LVTTFTRAKIARQQEVFGVAESIGDAQKSDRK